VPSRILREGILSSDRINVLSTAAEVFYRRLMSVVDDYGRFDGRPSMLRVSCYPLRVDAVREADLSRWIAECVKAGLLVLYAVDGKPYLEMQDFRQQARAKSRFPSPAEGQVLEVGTADATQPLGACLADATQAQTAVHLFRSSDSESDSNFGAAGPSPAAPPAPAPAARKPPAEPHPDPKGSRLPADWQLPPEWAAWCEEHRPDLDPQVVGDSFRDFWVGKPGKDGRKADWLATWRNWCRGQKPGTRQPGGQRGETFV
jgi:hypothetical protein